jgi:hypothetical protein
MLLPVFIFVGAHMHVEAQSVSVGNACCVAKAAVFSRTIW